MLSVQLSIIKLVFRNPCVVKARFCPLDTGHIAKNCSLRDKCLECRQSGHFQRNCPVRLRRLQRSVDSLDPVPPGDVYYITTTSSSSESNVSEHSSMNCSVISNTSTTNENISESNVMDNTSTTKENISESNVMDNTNTTKENISESNVMESTCTVNENISNIKNSNVNDNVSNSENVEIANGLTNSGSNLVSPGSSLNSASFSGGAEVPLSSVGVLDSAVRVSNVPSGLRLSKGSSSGVSKPAAARPSGLRPGLRKVISDWSLAARRKG